MEKRADLTSAELQQLGIKNAKTTKPQNVKDSIHMDRTVYYTVVRTDSNGAPLYYPNGDPIIENQAYVTAGRWVTKEIYDIALKYERDFKELNDLFRKDMDRQGIRWKLPKPDCIAIEGVTL